MQIRKRFAKVCKGLFFRTFPYNPMLFFRIYRSRAASTPMLLGVFPSRTVKIMQVEHMSVSFYLEGVQVVGSIALFPEEAQGKKRVPHIPQVETIPGVSRILCLPQVYHLMIFQCIVSLVQSFCRRFLPGEKLSEQRNRRISLPAQETVHLSRHIRQCRGTGRSDKQSEETHTTSFSVKTILLFLFQ